MNNQLEQSSYSDNEKKSLEATSKRKKSIHIKLIDEVKAIESSIWFHTLYAGLDGLSISYSTVKWLCDAYSPSCYRDNLSHIFGDLDFWLPLIIMTTLLISSASLFGVRASKLKDEELSRVEKYLRDWWPYFREGLNSLKNGYRGIRSLSKLLISLRMLEGQNINVIPIAIFFSFIQSTNNLYFLSLKNKRKQILKKSLSLTREVKKQNSNSGSYQINLLDKFLLSLCGNHDPLDVNNIYDLYAENSIVIMNQSTALSPDAERALFAQQLEAQNELKHFYDKYRSRLLVSQAISGLIDGPSLYVGITTLTKLAPTMLSLASFNFMVFWFTSVVTRIYDEYHEQKAIQLNIMRSSLELPTRLFKQKEQSLIDTYGKSFSDLKRDNFLETYAGVSLSRDRRRLNNTIEEMNELAISIIEIQNNIIALERPTYTSAVMRGLKDSLATYGLVLCSYFSIGIYCALYAKAFPILLVSASFAFSMASMATFISLRLSQTYQNLKKIEKSKVRKIDLDTFQSTLEIVTKFADGPSKSKTLIELFSANHELDNTSSHLMLLFWQGLSLIYGTLLAVKAFGKEFNSKATAEAQNSKQASEKNSENLIFSAKHSFFQAPQQTNEPSILENSIINNLT